MAKKVCIVAGVGPGNGTAFVRRFAAEGYSVHSIKLSDRSMDACVAEHRFKRLSSDARSSTPHPS